MKTTNLLGMLMLFLSAFSFISCDKDEEGFSKEEIQQALFEMKGTYNGTVQVSYYHGSDITEFTDAIAVSRDSLKFNMSLIPISEMVSDQNLAKHLREIAEVEVCAGYDFFQRDSWNINFGLHPKDVSVLGGYGTPPMVRIVFAKSFGGDVEIDKNFIMFNVSPKELWINGNKCETFKQLVYHFRGYCP